MDSTHDKKFTTTKSTSTTTNKTSSTSSTSNTIEFKEDLTTQQYKTSTSRHDGTLEDLAFDECNDASSTSTLTSSSTSSLLRKTEKLLDVSSCANTKIIVLKLPKVLNDVLNIRLNFDPRHNKYSRHKINKSATIPSKKKLSSVADAKRTRADTETSQEFIEVDISNLSEILDTSKRVREDVIEQDTHFTIINLDKRLANSNINVTSDTKTKKEIQVDTKKDNNTQNTQTSKQSSIESTNKNKFYREAETAHEKLKSSKMINNTNSAIISEQQQQQQSIYQESKTASSSYQTKSSSSYNNNQQQLHVDKFNIDNLLTLDRVPKTSSIITSALNLKENENINKKDNLILSTNEPKISSGSYSTSFYDDSKKGIEQGGSLQASNYAAEYANDNMYHKETNESTQYSSFIKKRTPIINYLSPTPTPTLTSTAHVNNEASTQLESKHNSFNSLNFLKQQQELSRKNSIDSNFSSVTRQTQDEQQLKIIENNYLKEHEQQQQQQKYLLTKQQQQQQEQNQLSRINESTSSLASSSAATMNSAASTHTKQQQQQQQQQQQIMNIPITVVNTLTAKQPTIDVISTTSGGVGTYMQNDLFRHHNEIFSQIAENMHRRHETFMQNARESMMMINQTTPLFQTITPSSLVVDTNSGSKKLASSNNSNFTAQSTSQFSSYTNNNGQVHTSKDARSDFVYGNPVQVKYVSENMSADSHKGNSYSKSEYSTNSKQQQQQQQQQESNMKLEQKMLNRQNLNQNYLAIDEKATTLSQAQRETTTKSVKQELLEVLDSYVSKMKNSSSSDRETLDILEAFMHTLSTKSESQIKSLVSDTSAMLSSNVTTTTSTSEGSSAFKKFEKSQQEQELHSIGEAQLEPRLSTDALQLLDYMMGAIKLKKELRTSNASSNESTSVQQQQQKQQQKPHSQSQQVSTNSSSSYSMQAASSTSTIQQQQQQYQAMERVDNFIKGLKQ